MAFCFVHVTEYRIHILQLELEFLYIYIKLELDSYPFLILNIQHFPICSIKNSQTCAKGQLGKPQASPQGGGVNMS